MLFLMFGKMFRIQGKEKGKDLKPAGKALGCAFPASKKMRKIGKSIYGVSLQALPGGLTDHRLQEKPFCFSYSETRALFGEVDKNKSLKVYLCY
jgi:hypothetical protein